MPDGFEAAGRFIRVEPPRLVVFSWEFADDEAASRTKHEGGEPGGAGAPRAVIPAPTRTPEAGLPRRSALPAGRYVGT